MNYLNHFKISATLVFFIGCLIGFLSHLSVQDGLYNSQIVVNLMGYAKSDLMYIWGVNLWTIMSQVSGILLLFGLNEFIQSILLSVLLNGISFVALYLILNSISKNSLFSLALVFINYFSKHYLHGLSYEVSMHSWDFYNSTWGNFGFHFALLSVGLISSNYLKFGYFLLGAMLSIHFFIGSFFIVTVLLANLIMKDRDDLKLKGIWFSYGLIFSIISYIINFSQYGIVDIGSAQIGIENYIKNWDNHRNSNLEYFRSAVLTNFLCLLYTGYLIFIKQIKKSAPLCWFFSISLCCFIIFLFYFFLFIDLFPFLYVAMPERMFNFLYYLSIPSLCAFVGEGKRGMLLLTFFLITVLDYFFHFFIIDLLSISFLLILFLGSSFTVSIKRSLEKKVVVFIILLSSTFILFNSNFIERIKRINRTYFNERNSFLKNTNGMLLVSPVHIASKVQLVTRRKIIMDATELSEISYAFHTYSKANSIMKDIYSLELNDDYKSLFINDNGVETVSPDYVKKVWEARSSESWESIFDKYQISQVLVPSSWNLKIKPIYTDSRDKIYEIN